MSYKKIIVFTLLLITNFLVSNLYLYAGVGTTGGVIFLQPVGARASSMGEAYTTAEEDVLGIYYNPASTARLKNKQVSILYQTGLIDDSFGIVSLGLPFSFGTLSLSLIYYTAGKIELIDLQGNEKTVDAQTDLLTTISYSKQLGKFCVGTNLKVLNSTLVGEITTASFAVDIGGSYKILEKLKVGLSIQNLGGVIKYDKESDILPLTMRLGVAYNLVDSLLLAADIVKISNDDKLKQQIGVEYVFKNLFAIRTGYKIGYDVDNLSIGFGLNYGMFSFDYAFVPYGELGSTSHRVSFMINF